MQETSRRKNNLNIYPWLLPIRREATEFSQLTIRIYQNIQAENIAG